MQRLLIGMTLVLAACGPGAAPVSPKVTSTNALMEASGNAAAIRELLDYSVFYSGMWFDEPACMAKFPSAQWVKADDRAAFAQCLAELHFQPSARTESLADVIVLTYPPGFEIDAYFVPEEVGPRMTWIGYVSRRDELIALPSIAPEALEGLRIDGDRDGPLDPKDVSTLEIDPDKEMVEAWFDVCIDTTGAVTSARLYSRTPPKAAHAFHDAASAWRFHPFLAAGRPLPVCSLVRMSYPPGTHEADYKLPMPRPPSAPRDLPEEQPIPLVPPKVLEVRRVAGNTLIEPDNHTKRLLDVNHQRRIRATYRLCLDREGRPERIDLIESSGYASYDRELAHGMSTWLYSPFIVNDKPSPVCTAITFIYKQT